VGQRAGGVETHLDGSPPWPVLYVVGV